MKKLFFLLILFSTAAFANCAPEEIEQIKKLFNGSITFLNKDEECRFNITVSQRVGAFTNITGNFYTSIDLIAYSVTDPRWKAVNNYLTTMGMRTNSHGQKWFSRDGKETLYFDSSLNNKKKESEYKMNLRDGIETTWYRSGKKESQAEYKDDLMNGTEKKWDETGQLISTTNYIKGIAIQGSPNESQKGGYTQALSILPTASDVISLDEKQKYFLNFETKPCEVEYKQSETVWEDRLTEDYKTYFSSAPESQISKLKSVKIDKFTILVEVETEGKFKEYKAPISLRINKFNYPKVVFGIPLKNSIACTEESIQSVFIDEAKQQETGTTKTLKIATPVKISIEAGDLIPKEEQIVTGKLILDKEGYILNSDINSPTTIEIKCDDCIDTKILKVTHDFRGDKQSALAKLKKIQDEARIKKEQAKLADEMIAKQKEAEETKKKNLEKANEILKYKSKCTDLGFVPNTDKHARCVLELMK